MKRFKEEASSTVGSNNTTNVIDPSSSVLLPPLPEFINPNLEPEFINPNLYPESTFPDFSNTFSLPSHDDQAMIINSVGSGVPELPSFQTTISITGSSSVLSCPFTSSYESVIFSNDGTRDQERLNNINGSVMNGPVLGTEGTMLNGGGDGDQGGIVFEAVNVGQSGGGRVEVAQELGFMGKEGTEASMDGDAVAPVLSSSEEMQASVEEVFYMLNSFGSIDPLPDLYA